MYLVETLRLFLLSLAASYLLQVASAERPSVLFLNIDDWNDWNSVLEGHPQAHAQSRTLCSPQRQLHPSDLFLASLLSLPDIDLLRFASRTNGSEVQLELG